MAQIKAESSTLEQAEKHLSEAYNSAQFLDRQFGSLANAYRQDVLDPFKRMLHASSPIGVVANLFEGINDSVAALIRSGGFVSSPWLKAHVGYSMAEYESRIHAHKYYCTELNRYINDREQQMIAVLKGKQTKVGPYSATPYVSPSVCPSGSTKFFLGALIGQFTGLTDRIGGFGPAVAMKGAKVLSSVFKGLVKTANFFGKLSENLTKVPKSLVNLLNISNPSTSKLIQQLSSKSPILIKFGGLATTIVAGAVDTAISFNNHLNEGLGVGRSLVESLVENAPKVAIGTAIWGAGIALTAAFPPAGLAIAVGGMVAGAGASAAWDKFGAKPYAQATHNFLDNQTLCSKTAWGEYSRRYAVAGGGGGSW